MAATVAIMLFMELPRVAFEAQRDKEQLLIDRGEQYSRAVNLYVRKFNRYPADFDALNNTQNIRFLRRKYVDPMTGKDDWRIVHVGPGGVFTDSLVYGKKKDASSTSGPQNFITEMQQTGGNQSTGNAGGVNVGLRQRQSDQAGAPGDLNNAAQPSAPSRGQQPGAPPAPPNEPVMVLPDGRIVPVSQGLAVLNGQTPQQPGQPGQPGRGGQPQAPGQPFPNNNNTPPGFQQAPPNPNLQGITNGQPNTPPAGATDVINRLLTTPRPGGLNGINGAPQQATVDQNGNPVPTNNGFGTTPVPTTNNTGTPLGNTIGGQTIGGGIAGVASKLEQEGIKTYKDRTNYKEWEFIYDIAKDPLRTGGAAAAATTANQNNANPNGTTNTNSPFGGNPTTSPFGTTSPITPTPPPPPPPPPGMTPQQ
jgi:hypothetical protein